ncbi:MAG: glycosyltransferase [Ruminococcaceae bacterium]|nr:glycosyltransferase [Oscillospiraceae bacterium]
MKVVQINCYASGSTGNIAKAIHRRLLDDGHESYIFYEVGNATEKNMFRIGNYFELHSHAVLARNLGRHGYFSHIPTCRLVRKLRKISPDVIHLHNLHGSYLNLPILFRYLEKSAIRVIITMHDCWLFTGKCPHFTFVQCEKWKETCGNCPQLASSPRCKIDTTKKCLEDKKRWLTALSDVTLVTPSQWLADLVKESFLRDCSVKVIHNGIDLSVFKPTESDFRARHHISESKKIILGVAFGWNVRKGLDVFVEMATRLDAQKYQIVLVGTDDSVDKQLPASIISIHRTHNQKELAEIYTAADLFVNPTREDTYPTVNMEAIACGTPVLTFRTGGSPEIPNATSGAVVDCDDIDALEKELVHICETLPYSKEMCLKRANEFDMTRRFREYIDLYTIVS